MKNRETGKAARIITLITMGVIPHDQLQASDKPFVDVLHVIIGSFGSVIMAVLAIVSLFGSMLGWILIGASRYLSK